MASPPILAQVTPNIPPLLQEENQCWSTTATMMVSWKQAASLQVSDVVAMAGAHYVDLYNSKLGITAAEFGPFVAPLEMTTGPLASEGPQFYIDLMNKHGPIWLSTDSNLTTSEIASHARLLVQISGVLTDDGSGVLFTYNDPASGTQVTESFPVFLARYEQEVTDNPDLELIPEIVFFTAEL